MIKMDNLWFGAQIGPTNELDEALDSGQSVSMIVWECIMAPTLMDSIDWVTRENLWSALC